jgi:hypothetical protein
MTLLGAGKPPKSQRMLRELLGQKTQSLTVEKLLIDLGIKPKPMNPSDKRRLFRELDI